MVCLCLTKVVSGFLRYGIHLFSEEFILINPLGSGKNIFKKVLDNPVYFACPIGSWPIAETVSLRTVIALIDRNSFVYFFGSVMASSAGCSKDPPSTVPTENIS